jgi:hypothetical protein
VEAFQRVERLLLSNTIASMTQIVLLYPLVFKISLNDTSVVAMPIFEGRGDSKLESNENMDL